MLIRAIQVNRHEMEKENLCSVFKSLLLFVAVTQMAMLSWNHKSVLSVKKHIMQYRLYVKGMKRLYFHRLCGYT